MAEWIARNEDLLLMLDTLLKENSTFNWDAFYGDRTKNVPFFEDAPDENLVAYVDKRWLPQEGKVLELGCGPGRNALFLAEKGYLVDALDASGEAVAWAKERAASRGASYAAEISFIHADLFKWKAVPSSYDIVYDSGCFHHIAPHRRIGYVDLVRQVLKPGGCFGLTCFEENGVLGGSDMSDWEVYRQMSMRGGLGYNPDKLSRIFHDFEAIEIRPMQNREGNSGAFGRAGLWTALFRKP